MPSPRPFLPLVLVDAGHGGDDPGAVGPSGTLEKTVALTAARELGRQLRRFGRYRVAFTRDSDSFVSLPDRVALAEALPAAAIVSIHADSSGNPRVRGASVYVRGGAASFPGRRGGLFSFPPVRVAAGSATLQRYVLGFLGDGVPLLDDPARQARLGVLAARDVPGVLVEMGFISNPGDEALLRRPAYRSAVAAALVDGLDRFLAPRRPSSGPVVAEAPAPVLAFGRMGVPGPSGVAERPRRVRAPARASRRSMDQAEETSGGTRHPSSGRRLMSVRQGRTPGGRDGG